MVNYDPADFVPQGPDETEDTRIIHDVGSPEWKRERRAYIGASEWAGCCNISDYPKNTGLAKWEEKTGRTDGPEFSKEQTRLMRIGSQSEKWILDDWCEENCGILLEYQIPLPIHIGTPDIRATVESIVELPDGERVVVEIKTTGSRNTSLGDPGTDQLGTDWLAQVQGEMVAADVQRAIVVVLNRDSGEVHDYSVPRNQTVVDGLIRKSKEFWHYVETDTVPPIDWAEPNEQMRRFVWLGCDLPSVDLRDTEAAELWALCDQLKAEIKAREATLECAQEQFRFALGDNGIARVSEDREVRVIPVAAVSYEVHRGAYCYLRSRKVKQ
jgi:hypothetical protein